jgi:hypothetical protein
MDGVTQQNAALVEEAAAAADAMQAQARELAALVGSFRIEGAAAPVSATGGHPGANVSTRATPKRAALRLPAAAGGAR